MSANEGQVIVVTGAASGIGRALVTQLANSGASAVAVDLSADRLAWTDEHKNIESFVGDISLEDVNVQMIKIAVERFGRLDAVALNAGFPAAGSVESLPMEDFDRVLEVNLRGVVLGTRAAAPVLREAGGGSIIVTASVSGLGGDPNMWAYNTAKGGVVNFVRAASLDLARDAIRVNAVCPGPIRTGMTAPIEESAPPMFEALRRQIPLQRWGEAHEVASVIAFLASPESSFMTGAIIPVDGGITANTGQFSPAERS